MNAPTFERLYEHGRARVLRTLARYGVRAELRDDLVQEVYLRVHRRISQTALPEEPWSWLAGLALNVARQHAKRCTREERKLDRDADPANVEDPVDEQAERRRRMQLELLLHLLPQVRRAAWRDVLLRHYIEGQPVAVIAVEVRRPLGTVKQELQRGRAALKHALDRHMQREWRAVQRGAPR